MSQGKSALEEKLTIRFDSNFYELAKLYHEKSLECKIEGAAGVFTEAGVLSELSNPSKADIVKEVLSRRDDTAYEKPKDAKKVTAESSIKDIKASFDEEEEVYMEILWSATVNLNVKECNKRKEDVARMMDIVLINVEAGLSNLVKCDPKYEDITKRNDLVELWKMLKRLSMLGNFTDEDTCRGRLRTLYNNLRCPEEQTVAMWYEHVKTVLNACDEFKLAIGDSEKAAMFIASLPNKFQTLKERQLMKGIDNDEKKFQSVSDALQAALKEESRLANRGLLLSSVNRTSSGGKGTASVPQGIMFVAKDGDQERRVKYCKKCGGTGHFLRECSSTMESLKASAKSGTRCTKCDGKGHKTSECVN